MELAIAVAEPEAPSESLEEFITRHSVQGNDGTASWSYRLDSSVGHDVLCLIISGPEAVELLTRACSAAGLVAGVNETLH